MTWGRLGQLRRCASAFCSRLSLRVRYGSVGLGGSIVRFDDGSRQAAPVVVSVLIWSASRVFNPR
jgi:hypothetical protein